MARVLKFLIRYFSNYYTLHRSDLAARAAPLSNLKTLIKYKDPHSTLKSQHTQLYIHLEQISEFTPEEKTTPSKPNNTQKELRDNH